MDRVERMRVHDVALPAGYATCPERHMRPGSRDRGHVLWALDMIGMYGGGTLLDVGCYDGWLSMALQPHAKLGLELVPSLAQAGNRYAREHGIDWTCRNCWLDTAPFTRSCVDLCLACEVLEHIPIEDVPHAVSLMEAWAGKAVMVTLPDQDHKTNPQHCWTPTEALIRDMWGTRPGFHLDYMGWDDTPVSNWMLTWRTR